ncbi:hypothetical protein SPRG_02039 [Saprolegnia parasitica CBS 223.65]|uniref:Uncharacterized protein n=1 Tax=Saprolegnia parasitica (strain CBS 223.65) TaxID=695850 RepID=A0A067CRC7_SAPPC|nr:hypothetical protein SPRG_02039 [Saprolegnia parasitica CBS 223.65]KDO33229.1 hypothetical protein SPRG_02039 [Saprolegnia parasitica CBS 223.65]|eukprot:XP_012195986.1 hypothetical protein SPRG_02039 [Saprolegnia parasitica CBS 223.65]
MTDDIASAIVDEILRAVQATRVVRHAATRAVRDMWEVVHLSARVSPSPACMQRIPEERSMLVLDSRAAQCIPSKAHEQLRWPTIASSPTSLCTASSLSLLLQVEPPPPVVCTRTDHTLHRVKLIKPTTKAVVDLGSTRSTTALAAPFVQPLPKMLPEITVGAAPIYVPPRMTPLCTVVGNQDVDDRPFLTVDALYTPSRDLFGTNNDSKGKDAIATRPSCVLPPKVEPRPRLPSTTTPSTRRLSVVRHRS